MSRAREHTPVHVTADDLAQAIDDLRADWSAARQQHWIADTPARPGDQPEPARTTRPPAQEQPAVAISVSERLGEARRHLAELERDYRDFHAGTGRWRLTPEGQAARERNDSSQRLEHARDTAHDPNVSRRDRRDATKALPALEAAAADAEQHWHSVGGPIAAQLHASVRTARQFVDRLETQQLTERLDRLQVPTPSRGIDRDLGISL
jgi:hypothetical protein